MDPLKTVEDILGDVESWPTYIIYMFLVEPNTISIKKVAAFMYGNAVPVTNAINCFTPLWSWTFLILMYLVL